MNNCLYCYQVIKDNYNNDFHPSCSKKLLGTTTPPLVDISFSQLEEIALNIVNKHISVTGVQPKLSLHLEKQKNILSRLTVVGVNGDFILKPPHHPFKDLPENEDLTMHLAETAGIHTAKHSLIRLASGELAYLTRRYDREGKKKLAVEDFCQLSERLTEHKYRGSLEKCGKLIDQFTENKGYDKQRFFELAIFCYLTGNADMHLKNFSLIESPFGGYTLSPAYDLVNTAIVMPEDHEESALTINGKKSKLKLQDFQKLASSLGIPVKVSDYIFDHFQKLLPIWQNWVQHSFLSPDMKEEYTQFIQQKFHELFKQ